MFKALLIWILSGFAIASGRITPIQPTRNSIHTAGTNILVSWADDSHRPSLEDTGAMQIDLYAGNATYVDTLAVEVLPTALSQTVLLPFDLPFTIADYTLRFITTVPPMTIYSAEFIVVSTSGPSITLASYGTPLQPTITVTRTTVVPAPIQRQAVSTTRIVTLTQLPVGLAQPALVSPALGPPVSDATLIEEVDPDDFITAPVPQEATPTGVTRVYPIFISRLANPSSTSPSSSTSSPSGDLLATTQTANATSSFTTSEGSTVLIPTNIVRPSSLKASKNSGVRILQSRPYLGLLAVIPVTVSMLL
ncbi:hypothetical protein FA13DRAFT_497408 [Coprinellus micaceus]|uniref:Ser-Thr-rich glycosyl-phosphatidyl-inositol-anchored membrane family-domain-containing protein n=1 Tax=Coprinellus micaceus TaxID=71717 RepID=A0A4Y7TA35_COPMI|nr:hypothetical protein FA13DRAFT_497408 [Coprinellus micaceus]